MIPVVTLCSRVPVPMHHLAVTVMLEILMHAAIRSTMMVAKDMSCRVAARRLQPTGSTGIGTFATAPPS